MYVLIYPNFDATPGLVLLYLYQWDRIIEYSLQITHSLGHENIVDLSNYWITTYEYSFFYDNHICSQDK